MKVSPCGWFGGKGDQWSKGAPHPLDPSPLCPYLPLHFRLGFRVPTTCASPPFPLHFRLGFRVSTTCGGKKFNDNRYWLGVPTTCKYNPHTIYIHIANQPLRCNEPPKNSCTNIPLMFLGPFMNIFMMCRL